MRSLDELHQPAVIDRVEEPTDVHIEHLILAATQHAALPAYRAAMLGIVLLARYWTLSFP